jgi:aryl-alcohol dehydrogenase-like predicted oxidoreductase
MSELPKRTLGRTGFEVTTLGFGAMELRGAPEMLWMDQVHVIRLGAQLMTSAARFIRTW